MTDNAAVAKSVNIEELFKIMDQMLPPIPSPHFEDAIYQDPVEAIYNTIYAAALDKFLETRWYTTSGLNALRRDAQLFAEFVAFFRAASLRLEEPSPPDLLAQETRLIWNLLNMCCTSNATVQEPNDFSTDMVELTNEGSGMSTDPAKPYTNDAPSTNIGNRQSAIDSTSQQLPDTQSDTANEPIFTTNNTTTTTNLASSDSTASIPSARLTALTALLTSSSPPQPPNPPPTPFFNPAGTQIHPALSPLSRQLQTRSDEFWSSVEKHTSAAADAERKTALQTARALLDGFENRDVVYTIMRMTWLQGLLARESPSSESGESSVKENEKDKEKGVEGQAQMERGRRFCLRILKNEAGLADGGDGVHSGIGKNVVAMRIAGMAVRAFDS
jgi:hypothetical protein